MIRGSYDSVGHDANYLSQELEGDLNVLKKVDGVQGLIDKCDWMFVETAKGVWTQTDRTQDPEKVTTDLKIDLIYNYLKGSQLENVYIEFADGRAYIYNYKSDEPVDSQD